jgi:ATP phosphoribosyltransferase regulatory subunit HisZ
MSLLRGRRYNRAKQTHGGEREASGQNAHMLRTAEQLAEQHGVDEKTIRRDGKFAEACERFGIAYDTALQASRVSSAFESCIRIQDLTFAHHHARDTARVAEAFSSEDRSSLLDWTHHRVVANHPQAKSSTSTTSHFS